MEKLCEMPKEIWAIADPHGNKNVGSYYGAPSKYFDLTSYTRTDTIPDHTALLKQARDAIFILQRFHCFQLETDKEKVICAITTIDAALNKGGG